MIERLEDRRLMAMTVSEGYPGMFEIYGTTGPDNLTITINNQTSTAKLSGDAGDTLKNVLFISVHFYEGDDLGIVNHVGEGPGNLIHTYFVGGPGNDWLAGYQASALGGEGDDYIDLTDSFRPDAHGGPGNDYISVSGLSVDAWVLGGDGNDFIMIGYNDYGLVVDAGDGSDVIYSSEHDDDINGGWGEDTVMNSHQNDEEYDMWWNIEVVE
jgi:hypothetical protein